jgi:fructosamine-3-kinase
LTQCHKLQKDAHDDRHDRQVVDALPSLLSGARIVPSLIHGDLWVGNAGATNDGPVVGDAIRDIYLDW